MKIKKTENAAEGKMAAIRAKLPGTASVQIEDDGKLVAQVTA
jgi:hypothetical protein